MESWTSLKKKGLVFMYIFGEPATKLQYCAMTKQCNHKIFLKTSKVFRCMIFTYVKLTKLGARLLLNIVTFALLFYALKKGCRPVASR